MSRSSIAVLVNFFAFTCIGQDGKDIIKKSLLSSTSSNACKCVDSITVYNKSPKEISKEISYCIDEQVLAYQMGMKLLVIDTSKAEEKNGKKQVNISIETNKSSGEYKKYYNELESYMMTNCPSIVQKINTNEKQADKSMSTNPKALDAYNKGSDELQAENYKKALKHFEKAVEIDSEFVFAWDNIGVCYRRLGDLDKALYAYNKSLEIDPEGPLPLQNIAIVYQYKKEYDKAIKAYEKLADLDSSNPEIYYGIGQIYTMYLNDYEKGLTNLCKAYNLYAAQKSPYRSDAQKLIEAVYAGMSKQGKVDKFNEILKANNITANFTH